MLRSVTPAVGRVLERLHPRWFVILAAAAAGVVVAHRFLRLAFATIRFPYPLDYGEGAVLDVAVRLARFEGIYPPDLQAGPWFVANYPPVYYLVRAAFLWLDDPALWQGRLVCQLSAAATAVLIGAVSHRLTRDVAVSWLAALTFLAIPFVSIWSQIDRVDVLSLLLSWLALWILASGHRRPHIIAAVLLFVASSYTRQTGAIAGVVGAYCWLWQQGHRRQANGMLAGVAALGLLTAAALHLVTSGGFLFHVVTATASPLSLDQLVNLGRRPIVLMPLLLLIACGAVAAGIRFRPAGWALVAGYVVASLVLALTVAKVGSAINYFLDLSAACALTAGVGAHWLRAHRFPAIAYALLLVPQMVWMGFITWPYAPLQARLAHLAQYRELAAVVRTTRGPILADEAAALLRTMGHEVDFHPFSMSQLVDAGLWDPRPFIERLERHEYELVLLRMSAERPRPLPNLWTPVLADALLEHYERTGAVRVDNASVIAIYRPASR
jgi:hypothetical protein